MKNVILGGLLAVVVAVGFLFVCWLITDFSDQNSAYLKPAIKAGFKAGTMFDVHLLLYADSTYYYSNHIGHPYGEWSVSNDTLTLIQNDNIQAQLYKNKVIYKSAGIWNWLHNMEFVEFDSAKVVKFPLHH